jgi:nucleoside-diphosphate-sugar epimerase
MFFVGDITDEQAITAAMVKVRLAAGRRVQPELPPTTDPAPSSLSPSMTSSGLQSAATVAIHTVSPVHGLGPEVYEKVNVTGTEVILRACASSSVGKLVFTSSGGVVYDGEENLVDVDERLAYPAVPLDAYNDTKARAEKLVLEANGKDGLLTCAIRPAGIFGYAPSWRSADLRLPSKGQPS